LAVLDEFDREMRQLYFDELKQLREKVYAAQEHLWQTISELTMPEVQQSALVSIFPVQGRDALESAISVGHLAEIYTKYIDYNDWTVTKYREIPYGNVKPKLVGSPFELIEFAVSGRDALEILTMERGIHKFKRKSDNTGNAMAKSYQCCVNVRPRVAKRARDNIEQDLIVESCRGLGGGNADGGTDIRVNIKDPVYGFTSTYLGRGNLQENSKKAVAIMKARIREFEEEKFESTRAQLDRNLSQETVRTYDHIARRVKSHHESASESLDLDTFISDLSLLSDEHYSVLAWSHKQRLKAIFREFSSVEYFIGILK